MCPEFYVFTNESVGVRKQYRVFLGFHIELNCSFSCRIRSLESFWTISAVLFFLSLGLLRVHRNDLFLPCFSFLLFFHFV